MFFCSCWAGGATGGSSKVSLCHGFHSWEFMLAPNGISRGGREESHRHVLRVHLQLSQRELKSILRLRRQGRNKHVRNAARPSEGDTSGAPQGKRPAKGLFISLHPLNGILNTAWRLQWLSHPQVHRPRHGKALRQPPAFGAAPGSTFTSDTPGSAMGGRAELKPLGRAREFSLEESSCY